MIPENFEKLPFKKYGRFRARFIAPLNRDGLLTKAGVKQYQERFMQENHNRLYGIAYGMEIGLCDRTYIVNRMKNVFVSGDSGTGKSHNYILPNLLTESHSAVVLDSSDTLYKECGDYLRKRGHKVWHFNVADAEHSWRFDPFRHFENKKLLVDTLCGFLLSNNENPYPDGDPYYVILENLIFRKIVEYVVESDELNEEDRTLETVTKILNKLDDAPQMNSEHYEKRLLQRLGLPDDDKTFKSYHNAVWGLKIKLMPLFDENTIKCFTETSDTDNVDIETLGSKQSYLFIGGMGNPLFSELDTSFYNRLLAMLTYSVGIAVMSYAERCIKDKTMLHTSHFLPNPLHYYLDDFHCYRFPLMPTAFTDRRYGVSSSYITQDIERLKKIYGEDWSVFISGCDTHICTGITLREDAEFFSKTCGRLYKGEKERGLFIPPAVYGSEKSLNSEPVITPDDILSLKGRNKWLVSVRDVYPVICDKLDPKTYRKK